MAGARMLPLLLMSICSESEQAFHVIMLLFEHWLSRLTKPFCKLILLSFIKTFLTKSHREKLDRKGKI